MFVLPFYNKRMYVNR